MKPPALQLHQLTLDVATPHGPLSVLDRVDLQVAPGQTVALVGESGSGKSTVGLSALQLLATPPFIRRHGEVWLQGVDLAQASEAQLCRLRGRQVAMVFQDPMTSLNPTMTVGHQLDEVRQLHHRASRREARRATLEVLAQVGLADVAQAANAYPHTFSGGMRQRVVLAMALLGEPALLVADEPTTALDVTVQAQVLALLAAQVRRRNMATLLISHDLGVVAGMADRVSVMYAGQVVEEATAEALYAAPQHPYTATLLQAARNLAKPLPSHDGAPQRHGPRTGCSFAPRCWRADGRCQTEVPQLRAAAGTGDHKVRCHHPLATASQAGAHAAAGVDHAPRHPFPAAPAEGAVEAPTEAPTEAPAASPPEAPTEVPAHGPAAAPPALRVADLSVHYGVAPRWPWQRRGRCQVVCGVSLEVAAGEALALVGESGCGKSTLAKTILQLQPAAAGTVHLGETPLHALWRRPSWWRPRPTPTAALRPHRRRIQAVFQDPQASLDGRQTALAAVMEPLLLHQPKARDPAVRQKLALALLAEVGLDAALAHRLPHALSGGQRQRLALARALAPEPEVLVADEPTSALDVAVKGQVLALLRRLTAERRLATLFVSHDLAAVRAVAQRCAVMLRGTLVEVGPTAAVATAPFHPYTQALLAAEPLADPALQRARLTAFAQQAALEAGEAAPGGPPASELRGCPFVGRCGVRVAACFAEAPALVAVAEGHLVACHVVQSARRPFPTATNG